jgi:hypothetical protein
VQSHDWFTGLWCMLKITIRTCDRRSENTVASSVRILCVVKIGRLVSNVNLRALPSPILRTSQVMSQLGNILITCRASMVGQRIWPLFWWTYRCQWACCRSCVCGKGTP